jgi:hypothetical protein
MRHVKDDPDATQEFRVEEMEPSSQKTKDNKIPNAGFVRRIMPRSFFGILLMILVFSLGMGLSGAAFYLLYNNKTETFEKQVNTPIQRANSHLIHNAHQVNAQASKTLSQIKSITGPLQSLVSDPKSLNSLPIEYSTKLWRVTTANSSGKKIVGTATAVVKSGTSSYFLTSSSFTNAGSVSPGPQIILSQGSKQYTASVYSVDSADGISLLKATASVPIVTSWIDQSQEDGLTGARVYGVSAWAPTGAVAIPGNMLNFSSVGWMTTLSSSSIFDGSPIVTAGGKIIGITSSTYSPGYDSNRVVYAPSLAQICSKVLSCNQGAVNIGGH